MSTRVGVLDRGRLVLQEDMSRPARRRPGWSGCAPLTSTPRSPCSTAASSDRGADRGRRTRRRRGRAERAPGRGRRAGHASSSRCAATLEEIVLAARSSGAMIRVELVKLLRRPRTWVTIAALNALPTLVAILLAVTDLGPAPRHRPAVPVRRAHRRHAVPAGRAGHRAAAVPAGRGRRRRRRRDRRARCRPTPCATCSSDRLPARLLRGQARQRGGVRRARHARGRRWSPTSRARCSSATHRPPAW